MAKQKLFEYAVLFHKKSDNAARADVIESTTVVTEVTRVLADNERHVSLLAARGIPDSYTDKLDDVEIVIRPF